MSREITGGPGNSPPASRAPRLDDPLQYVKGVGPRIAEQLLKLNLKTVEDLLRHLPRRWEDRTNFRHVSEAREGEVATIRGYVAAATTTFPRQKLSITKAVLNDQGDPLTLVWFNQPYLERTFKTFAQEGREVIVYGQVRRVGWSAEMSSPEWEELSEESDSLSINRIVPVYPATEGVSQKRLRRIIDTLLHSHLGLFQEPLPADVLLQHKLMGICAAMRQIHFPESLGELEAARRRLIFEEFFLLQTMLAVRRHRSSDESAGPVFKIDFARLQKDLREIVPFTLTGAQQRSIREIAGDVGSGHVMNRLLQGDVGSGKTMVALASILMAIENGYQAALMAPTEILAQQHAIVLRRLLEPIGIAVELATGSQGAREKRESRERIYSGQSRVAVGTHALIQEDVEFAKLGLVIIDEQHRFGVLQRQALRLKGETPHVLVMTATPIPRTLTLTLYGDLDVSLLDELPPGRKPITTHWKTPDKRSLVYAGAQRLIVEGRQVYVVCPLVEESDKLQAKSAIQLCEHIRSEVFPQYRIGLLHGQLSSEDKDRVMAAFKAGELDVLVATTVIEVGIDVPNACAIIIEDADRFGLAQLHQLRGRVGRGQYSSYCVLLADPKTETGRARMEVMTATSDGFRISEEDLKLRGPGEFYGTKQSGMPELMIADLLKDQAILFETRETAFRLVERDPGLKLPENRTLRESLQRTAVGLELMSVS